MWFGHMTRMDVNIQTGGNRGRELLVDEEAYLKKTCGERPI